jgi:radical SAM family uncharacterized protein/radical SAM-linked protein
MSQNLIFFQKPSRYIGNEFNIIRKNKGISVALCFPDTYEIGMSHLGLRILYSIINTMPSAYAERVFAPWIDFESYLRAHNLPLTSIEHNRPLRDFDIIGFTLQYELSYTNVLNMLDLGGIPVRAEERSDDHPLVLAGGPCTVNPLPLIPFVDAFVIGDGEEVIGEIIEICSGDRKKDTALKELSELEGLFVPSVHSTHRDTVRRRVVKNLDAAHFPVQPVIPYTPIVHDRVTIEISRGCTRGCRFCQAGMIYRPLRERSMETVLSLAKDSIRSTGYEEISFSSLSTGDYGNLLPLIRSFHNSCHMSRVAVSLPSLRVGAINRDVLKEIKSVRKTGFTIAPEAGTARLRDVINKDFTEEEYEKTLEKVFSEGWHNIKLYFMIGLPTETHDDIDGIIRMAETAFRKGKALTGTRINLNVGISAFVPKPHTPFQWLGQLPYKYIREKQDFLRKTFRKKGINFKGQHVESSLLEAVFSRGDTGSSLLLEEAWRSGCRFDSWSETFDFDRWLDASGKTGIDLFSYATREFDLESELPWDIVDTGLTTKFLASEFLRALQGRRTEDCRRVCCTCGLLCKERTHASGSIQGAADNRTPDIATGRPGYLIKNSRLRANPLRTRLRIRFSKTGILRYLSHREVMTAFLRSMNRAGVPLAYSEGFHPHPKVSFGPALPVGVEGLNEYFDVELRDPLHSCDLPLSMNHVLPAGLKVLEAVPLIAQVVSLDDFVSRYEYEVIIDNPAVDDAIRSFLSAQNRFVSRKKKMVDVRQMVEKAEINDVYLKLILVDMEGGRVRLFELLQELFQRQENEVQRLSIRRLGLFGKCGEEWLDPLEGEKVWRAR